MEDFEHGPVVQSLFKTSVFLSFNDSKVKNWAVIIIFFTGFFGFKHRVYLINFSTIITVAQR